LPRKDATPISADTGSHLESRVQDKAYFFMSMARRGEVISDAVFRILREMDREAATVRDGAATGLNGYCQPRSRLVERYPIAGPAEARVQPAGRDRRLGRKR